MSITTTQKSGSIDPGGRPAREGGALHAERQLLDGIERIARTQPGRASGWALMALHLSSIPPPGARAHHRRVAADVLAAAAARDNGQVFVLANGDMALLFRPMDGPEALSAALARLFKADMPDPAGLRSLWMLPEAVQPALAYVMSRVAAGDGALPTPEPRATPSAIAAMDAIVQTGLMSELTHRQTAIMLRPGRAVPMVPLFRKVAISTTVLENRIAEGNATADPFLFSHLGARLDRRMLAELKLDVPDGGLLSMGLGAAALHIKMTMAGILSQGFANFAAACPKAIAAGLRIGIEVAFMEAFADIKSFILARERLRLAGLHLVLDGVSHQTLMLTSPIVLEPSLVKLDWSPAMQDAEPALASALAAALARLGVERIVLNHTDSEAAITWGLLRGITRFQGRYVDTMLGAERLRACPMAKGCTLRQCTDRAAATGPAGRAGCSNHDLLDLGAPFYADTTKPPPDRVLVH